jgi:hypothetical protein
MGLLDDDDFKISMDDIKDMVSELFGEKVEKLDTGKAKEMLRESTKEFLNKGIKEVSAEKLSAEEENMLKEFESAHAVKYGVTQPGGDGDPWLLIKQAGKEKPERKEDISKKESGREPAELAADALHGIIVNYSEKMSLINMFEQSQRVFSGLLNRLMRKNAVETMFLKTLEKCIERHTDVLKKTDSNQYGKLRQDGTLEVARLAANLNAMYMPEAEKTGKFLDALHDVFEERLLAVELALGIETKDEVLSNLLAQAEKIFGKKGYSQRLKVIFSGRIVPDTALKQGG